jgi:hypothetical protein
VLLMRWAFGLDVLACPRCGVRCAGSPRSRIRAWCDGSWPFPASAHPSRPSCTDLRDPGFQAGPLGIRSHVLTAVDRPPAAVWTGGARRS